MAIINIRMQYYASIRGMGTYAVHALTILPIVGFHSTIEWQTACEFKQQLTKNGH